MHSVGNDVYIVAPEWKITAGSQKPVATLKVNTGETGGGGVVVLPAVPPICRRGPASGSVTTATSPFAWMGRRARTDGNCFKFKTEIKAYDADYDVCTTAIPGEVRPACS